MKIEKVLVVGCGTMGGQIAMQTALCSYQVCAYDLKPEVVQWAKAYSDKWFAGRVAKGRLTEEQARQAQKRLNFTTDLPQAAHEADLVIEAVPDVAKIKRAVLSQVQPGDIILLHDIYATSVDAALQIVDALTEQGYWFVTVEELLELNGVEPKAGTLYRSGRT